jgi:hypothetical protein
MSSCGFPGDLVRNSLTGYGCEKLVDASDKAMGTGDPYPRIKDSIDISIEAALCEEFVFATLIVRVTILSTV